MACDFTLGYFLPFYPKKSKFSKTAHKMNKKMKKTPGDIIILDMSTKNYGQMIYGS